jgi:hypothetical protein
VTPDTTSPSFGRTFHRLSPTEIVKRRKQGLCFNCNEKFAPGHHCTQLISIEVFDSYVDTMDLTEEYVEEVHVSLQELTGLWSIRATDTMQLTVCIGKYNFTTLLDRGSTHNLFDEGALIRAGLTATAWPGLRVMVANGDQVASKGVCRAVPLLIGDQHFTADCFTIPLGGFDIVLGVCWLRTLGPILWDFNNMTVSFTRGGLPVTWTGCSTPRSLATCFNGAHSGRLDDKYGC